MTDQLDFPDVAIVGGSPDVHAWPATAAITRVEFQPNNFTIEFTKRTGPDAWPDVVPPGFDGPICFTLWIVVRTPAGWFTTGCVEFWRTRPGVGGPFSRAAQNWYFHAPEMASVQPSPGQLIGVFVTAGDARRKDTHTVAERSAIVQIAVPPNDTGVFTFDAVPPPIVTVPPLSPPTVSVADDFEQLLASMDRILLGMAQIVDANAALVARLDKLAAGGIRVHL